MNTDKSLDYNRRHDLTVEEIRDCESFAGFTDEQALEVIETFKLFTKIAYDAYQKERESLGNSDKKP